MSLSRMKYDAKFIILNCLVNRIPSWTIRKFFYCLFKLKIGSGSRIGIKTVIIEPSKITIGNNSVINEFCFLDGRGGLKIGNNVSISMYSKIVTASHKSSSPTFEYFSEETVIEDQVWIGINAIVLNGSQVGKNCIIGAGSVFKGKSLPGLVYAGNPAKVIKERQLEKEYDINYHPYFR